MNSSNSGRGLWRVIGVSNQPNNTATSRSFSKSSRDKSKDRFTITKKSENERVDLGECPYDQGGYFIVRGS